MSVQRIERAEVLTRSVEVLGLDHDTIDLFSIEGLCASLRRAASFLCPASPRQIVDAVFDALAPLSAGLERDAIAEALDALIAYGDILELRPSAGRARLLFLGPPSFVEKHAGEYLLLGIRPRAVPLVEEAAEDLGVVYDAHTRSVLTDPASGDAPLLAAGLHRLSKELWAKAPRRETSSMVIEKARRQLAAEDAAPGAVSGLTIIDPAKPVRYYKGRWRKPAGDDNGIFTGRRPQAYGAPIWCVADIADGVPQAILDLPVNLSLSPGWDEARRIQAALDSENGTPQAYRLRDGGPPGQNVLFDFFAPLPTWAERYLAISGRPAQRGPGSLFSYSLPGATAAEAQEFLSAALWMTQIMEDR